MAISVNWNTKVIFVPQVDLVLVSGTLYELDTNAFRLELKDLEDDEGIPFLDTHRHNTEVTVAGTTFARVIEIINGYSIEFEDGQYSVRLVGSNNNFFDVDNGILVQNQVQVIPGNSAGLITFGVTAPELAHAVWGHDNSTHTSLTTMGGVLNMLGMLGRNKTITDPVAGTITVYEDDGITVAYTAPLWEDAAATQPYRGQGAERREQLT
jgi:hypothetical protein